LGKKELLIGLIVFNSSFPQISNLKTDALPPDIKNETVPALLQTPLAINVTYFCNDVLGLKR
jgi:hypothetical protein